MANILVPICHSSNEQKLLCQAGAIPILARLITERHAVLQIPALKCLAAMCFTNKSVSDIICATTYVIEYYIEYYFLYVKLFIIWNLNFLNSSHNEETIPNILSTLVSRARIPEVQIAAARCLTYIHRSGSLESLDSRIVYRTLPCLARLCSQEFNEEIRATAAETLAYLAEVHILHINKCGQ